MKLIKAIIRPEKFDAVRNALEAINYPGMTLADVRGHGKQKGMTRVWRGQEYKVDFLPKIKMEIVVLDEDVAQIVEAIAEHSRTGEPGDGKIFVLPVEDVVQVRTGKKGKTVI